MNKILLTRLLEDNVEDRHYFEELGYQCVELPLMELALHQPLERIQSMEKAEWIFLTSQHSASFFIQQFLQQFSFQLLQEKKFAVIGEKTAGVLMEKGLKPQFQACSATKKGLFAEWLEQYKEPTAIFYPKSSLADDEGEALFATQGHQLQTAILYDNYFPIRQQEKLRQLLDSLELTAVYFSSPSLWKRFYSVYSQWSGRSDLKFYCVGSTTQSAIQSSGYPATIKN